MGVVSNNWLDCVLLSTLPCSDPRADRCSNPLPWDPPQFPSEFGSPPLEGVACRRPMGRVRGGDGTVD